MKSSKYWERRFLANKNLSEDYIFGQVNALKRNFAAFEREAMQSIEKLYAKYAVDAGIDIAAAKSFLSGAETKLALNQYYDLVKMSLQDGDAYAEKLLQAWAKRERITRLEQMQMELQGYASELYGKQHRQMSNSLLGTAKDVYYRQVWATQTGMEAFVPFYTPPASVFAAIAAENWQGGNWSGRLWNNRGELGVRLNDMLYNGVMNGASIERMASDLRHATGASRFDALRLVRTEHAHVYEEATRMAYDELGVRRYRYIATLDLRTSAPCRSLDGKVFDLDKEQTFQVDWGGKRGVQTYTEKGGKTGVNYPPMLPFCRSTTVPADVDIPERAARDSSGKSITVPGNMNYEDWFKEYVVQGKWYTPEMTKRLPTDNKIFAEYREILGEFAPQTFAEFLDLKYNNGEEYGVLKAQAKGMTYYNKALHNEKAITAQVKKVGKATNMEVVGLEYRIKSKDSYLRKIRSNYSPDGNEYEINDILRYTYTDSPDTLVDNTKKAMDLLAKDGGETVKIKNTWTSKNNPYKGINTIVKFANGQKFEVQYHTPESFALKNGELHRLYEEERLIKDKKSKRAIELRRKMQQLSKNLHIPKGIDFLRNGE